MIYAGMHRIDDIVNIQPTAVLHSGYVYSSPNILSYSSSENTKIIYNSITMYFKGKFTNLKEITNKNMGLMYVQQTRQNIPGLCPIISSISLEKLSTP